MISLKSRTTGLPSRPSTARAGALVAAASLLAVFVAGCSNPTSTEETTSESAGASSTPAASASTSAAASAPASEQPLPEGPQIIAESARTTETLRSVHLVLKSTNLPNLPVESVDADVTNLPEGAASAVGTANFRPSRDEEYVQTEFLAVDRVMYVKAPDGSYTDMGASERIYDPGVILDKDMGLAHVISEVQDPVVIGREDLGGVATIKVEGFIAPDVIDPVVPRLGADTTEPLPVTLWIADVPPPAAGEEPTIADDAQSTGAGPNLVQINIVRDDGNVNVVLSKWAEPVTIPTP